ncbi:MAG: peptidoglycan binding domain-containing protein, partial [Chloroflexota bacterium]
MRIDRRLTSNPAPLRPRRQFKLPLGGFRFWLTLSAIGILGSLIVLAAQLFLFARALETLPAGLTIGEMPVGGLSNKEAELRLRQAYAAPVVLDYRGNIIRLEPTQVNFQLDTSAMFSQVVLTESSGSVWADLWAHLWGSIPPAPKPIALQASYDETLLETFLADLAARYDNIGQPAQADPITLGFIPGSSGYKLDKDSALTLIN